MDLHVVYLYPPRRFLRDGKCFDPILCCTAHFLPGEDTTSLIEVVLTWSACILTSRLPISAALSLPDGGSGGATRVVPSHSSGHRSPATDRSNQWMNEQRMKTAVNIGGVSLVPAHEACWGVKVPAEHCCGSENLL
jgi:hypothetical protein